MGSSSGLSDIVIVQEEERVKENKEVELIREDVASLIDASQKPS